MYQLLGEVIVDTNELIAFLDSKGVKVVEDITTATKRDDAIGFRIIVPISELKIETKTNYALDEMDNIMHMAERLYRDKLEYVLPDYMRFRAFAYRYDEVENAIILNVAIMDWEIGRRKLDDVIKRLFDV